MSRLTPTRISVEQAPSTAPPKPSRHGRHDDRRERIAELALTMLVGPDKAKTVVQTLRSQSPVSPDVSLPAIEELKTLLADEEEVANKVSSVMQAARGARGSEAAELPPSPTSAQAQKAASAQEDVESDELDIKRNDAFEDLCRTEDEFVDKIKTVVEKYLVPLRDLKHDLKPVLSTAEIKVVFGTAEDILRVHLEMLALLANLRPPKKTKEEQEQEEKRKQEREKAAKEGKPAPPVERKPRKNVRGVGDVFIAIAPKLRIYGEYVKNCPAAVAMCLRLEETNSAFASWMLDVTTRCEGIMKYINLSELLPCPLNQITNYEIFLQTMVDNTRPKKYGIAEVESLANAATLMKQINNVVKISYEMSHCRQKVVQVQTLLEGTKLLDGGDRRFIRDLGVTFSVKKAKKQTQRRMYIFSDLILFADGNHVTDHTSIEGLKLEKEDDPATMHISSSSLSCYIVFRSDFEKENITKEIMALLHHNKNDNMVFGNDLNTLLAKEDRLNSVPIEVEKMIECLSTPASLDFEGLFRVAGSLAEVQELKKRMDNGWSPEVETLVEKAWPHTIASLLKVFFREMPEPLMTFQQYEACLDMCEVKGEQQIPRLVNIVQALPLTNQTLLKFLITFLRKVAEHSSKNLMNSRNLALMFAPNILRPKEETVESSLRLPHAAEFVQILIDNAHRVWKSRQLPSMPSGQQAVGSPFGKRNLPAPPRRT
eukprot:m51a1_g8165 putative domain-containing protein (712) ;mRNA; r:83327-86473